MDKTPAESLEMELTAMIKKQFFLIRNFHLRNFEEKEGVFLKYGLLNYIIEKEVSKCKGEPIQSRDISFILPISLVIGNESFSAFSNFISLLINNINYLKMRYYGSVGLKNVDENGDKKNKSKDTSFESDTGTNALERIKSAMDLYLKPTITEEEEHALEKKIILLVNNKYPIIKETNNKISDFQNKIKEVLSELPNINREELSKLLVCCDI